jgi:hypothetical protein
MARLRPADASNAHQETEEEERDHARTGLNSVGSTNNTQPTIEGKPATRGEGKEGKENAGFVIDL